MKTKSQLPNKMEEFLKKMTSHGNPVNYLRCVNMGEHQSKMQKACQKEEVMLEYTTPYMPQLNRATERRFYAIKEGALDMLLNAKLNDISHKMMWSEAVHMCKCIRNSMATKGSTNSPFEIFHGEKLKIIVCPWSLYVLPISLNGTNLRSIQQTIHTRLSWSGTQTIIQDTNTSCIIMRPRGSYRQGILSGQIRK